MSQDSNERDASAEEPQECGVEVSRDQLSPDALRGLVESYVGREGTDYGARECSLEEKVADVMRQLEAGEARIYFDPNTESVNIVPSD